MLCESCGKKINEGAKFCVYCGNKVNNADVIEKKLYCDNCGSQLELGSKFCNNCGNILNQQSNIAVYKNNDVKINMNYEVTKNRNFIKYYLLSSITLGIYGIVFMHKFIKDLNYVCDDGDDSPNIFLLILLSMITCGIYHYYWIYKQSNRIKNASLKLNAVILDDGKSVISISIMIAILSFGVFGIFLGYYFLIRNFNVLAEKF
ncbi:DUF4234 domain-containing protein [Brachyspira hyodysenteriae]|uniref:DZANK-type domain-containing protein n=1 Tax=Brachyspira murdochii TaxID=84378 RepID=A0ABX5B3M5_9SPIR|nr:MULTISPECIES: DUF4234 domain-containing protein [Brachyspira]MCZ9838542.1 DUF4234 domain-containing protein [Brachyspira hyodysenteriae]MCZ9847548.1 DUF4234 domain-containing protein [Brachyspira hyodysenteriae]MCZ9851244.1 DUF4234 domain-containing protein [Brachyspira hyodysenteriae]MCZ9860030.1 DUF4234 domain-containing protein [Brachyspira hyodysenteriae]MCZ9870539.1 DUF4234 domain-containing protein [Brachyspira hyodysenteriae]